MPSTPNLDAQIDGPQYLGPATFMKARALSGPAELDAARPDVAIVGTPWDDGTTYRPGARFGPRAVGGRADVMAAIDEHKVVQIGTFNGNPLTMATAKTTLTQILTAHAYAHFDALAEALEGGLRKVIDDYQLPYHPITLASRRCVTYRKQRVRNYRDYLAIDKKLGYLSWLYQCNRGVLMAPGAEENWTLSVQHSEEDVLRYVSNFEEMARDLAG